MELTDPDGADADDLLLTQTEAAELRGLTRSRINKLIREGRLRSVQRDGREHVYLSEVLAYKPRTRGPGRKIKERED